MAYRTDSMGARGWSIGWLVGALLGPACVTDHGALAKRDGEGGRSSGGRGPSGGGGFGGAPVIRGGGPSGGSAGRAPDEPPGPNALTFVHGVVDAADARLCFRTGRGASQRVLETPEGAEALVFGASVVLGELDDIDLEVEDLQPLLVTGDLSLVDGEDCAGAIERALAEQSLAAEVPEGEQAAAGAGGAVGSGSSFSGEGGGGAGGEGGADEPPPPPAPALRLAELPVIAAGTLTSGYSWLFVANGCVGGPAFTDELEQLACGDTYTPRASTLSASLVRMSRVARYDGLGLQVVHASVATPPVSVRSAPLLGSDAGAFLIDGIEPGEIQPRRARTDMTRAGWGAGLQGWRLEVIESGSLIYAEPWTSAIERGVAGPLEEGKNYVVVLLGPRLDVRSAGFWNGPAIAVVASDP